MTTYSTCGLVEFYGSHKQSHACAPIRDVVCTECNAGFQTNHPTKCTCDYECSLARAQRLGAERRAAKRAKREAGL